MRRWRIAPPWWPLLGLTAPLWGPAVLLRHRRFVREREAAERRNRERLAAARPLALPEVDRLELTVIVEARARPGFRSEAGVSYRLRTNRGALLMDVGFGPAHGVFAHNAERLGFSWEGIEALAISHLHLDHMGGARAQRRRRVAVPGRFAPPRPIPCFLPDRAEAPGFEPCVIGGPRELAAGIGTTGPLTRALFFLGSVEEQALLVRLRGRGLVVVTGCGHPTLPRILEMAARLSNDPVYAVIGGLHFPLTGGRDSLPGIEIQMFAGTGKPPWRRITDEDLTAAIDSLRAAGVRRLLLSAHDTCNTALHRFESEAGAEFTVLEAGAVEVV